MSGWGGLFSSLGDSISSLTDPEAAQRQSQGQPEPEAEQPPPRAPLELVALLTAEEGRKETKSEREALLSALHGENGSGLHAEVAAALKERLQLPSTVVKIKTTELIALLLREDSGFATAARPHLQQTLAEHTRFGELDPKDDSAALVRKAAAESINSAAWASRDSGEEPQSKEGAASEGVPPDSAVSSSPEPEPGLGELPAPAAAPAAGAAVERSEFESVAQSVQDLENDIEQLENAQIQQASAAEAGQQQLLARVLALDEQLRQLSAQVEDGRGAQEQGAAAAGEAATALAAQADAQKQQADRLSALEAQMQTMASELKQSTAQVESERARAVAAEERLSALLTGHEQQLESHEQKLQESDKFEISTSEALANEVDDAKKECLSQVRVVADSNAMLKEAVNVLMEQLSQAAAGTSAEGAAAGEKLAEVEQALREETSALSSQLSASVEELRSRIDFLEVQQQAELQSEAFTGQSGGADQSTAESGSALVAGAPADVVEVKRTQAELADSVRVQTERVSALEQQLAQQLSNFNTLRQSEQTSRVKQNEMFEVLVETKIEGLKQELLEAALEQQQSSESQLASTHQKLQGTMDEQNKQTAIQLQQLKDGLLQSKENRRKELQAEAERLSGEIDAKVAEERDQAVAREMKAAELAETLSAAVTGEIEQLKQGQSKQSEDAAQAQAAVSERLQASELEFAAVREEMVQLVQNKLAAHTDALQSQQADRDENLKEGQQKIFGLINERVEVAEALETKTEDLNRRVGEALMRADGFDESMAEHHKALAESDRRVEMLQERLETVEAAHAAAQAALESASAKEKAEAEAAAAGRVAQVEQDVSALRDVVQSGHAAAAAATASLQDGLSEIQAQVAQASAAAESAKQTSSEHRLQLAEIITDITGGQQTLQEKVEKQEQIVKLLAVKTKGVEDIAGKKLEKLEKEVDEGVRSMAATVDGMVSQLVDFTTCAPQCIPPSVLLARLVRSLCCLCWLPAAHVQVETSS